MSADRPAELLPDPPEGYVPFAWWTYLGTYTGHTSVMHYAPAEQGDRPFKALCGARMPTKRSSSYWRAVPAQRECERTCQRCIAAAAKAQAAA